MDSYVGQIRIFGGRYAPQGWAFCNGALLDISSYTALYSLIGTTYGGNGTTKFALPNLQLSLPVGRSNSPPPNMASTYSLGATGGTFAVTLTMAQIPAHTHAMTVSTSTAPTTATPSSSVLLSGVPTGFTNFADPVGTPSLSLMSLSANAISTAGGSQSHFNGMPTMPVNYIICLTGLFPQFS